MRKKPLNIFTILTILLFFTCQSLLAGDFLKNLFRHQNCIEGSGDLITAERDVKSFNEIKTGGAFDIYIEAGKKQSVKITFDDNLIDIIETEVRGKTLRIDNEESYCSDYTCKIEITLSELEAVSLSGSGNIEIINLSGELFECSIAGSGDIDIDGEIKEVELKISGSGEIDATDLITDDAYVKISGSGDIRVHARESFDGNVSGSGNIFYYGEPKSLTTNVSGSGRIRKMR